MRAYDGDPLVKEAFLHRLREFAGTGRVRRRIWWDGKKGCLVGVVCETTSPAYYAHTVGIPLDMVAVMVQIFEHFPLKRGKTFGLDFLEAIEPGADLEGLCGSLMTIMAAKLEELDLPIVEPAPVGDNEYDAWFRVCAKILPLRRLLRTVAASKSRALRAKISNWTIDLVLNAVRIVPGTETTPLLSFGTADLVDA